MTLLAVASCKAFAARLEVDIVHSPVIPVLHFHGLPYAWVLLHLMCQFATSHAVLMVCLQFSTYVTEPPVGFLLSLSFWMPKSSVTALNTARKPELG